MSGEFLLVVVVVVLAPGVDLLMVLRNTVAGGRRVGAATVAGVGTASAAQGALVAVGVGALIVQSQWLFQTLRWAGVVYLIFLGVQSLRSALRRTRPALPEGQVPDTRWSRGFRQGFLCNITNPKMLVFYLFLLPQFVEPAAPLGTWLLHAWAMPAIGCAWLLLVAVLAGAVRDHLLRPLVRRVVDGLSGVALVGFGTRLALDH
jgi:threonine/homoserine/homoserine lactone efflux protein